MSKELLEEIVGQIRDDLPTGTNLYDWFGNANRLDIADGLGLHYQWGRLLGAAEMSGYPDVLEMLDFYEVPLFPDSVCLDWFEYLKDPSQALRLALNSQVHVIRDGEVVLVVDRGLEASECTLSNCLYRPNTFGKEAEELRKGIETLINEYEPVPGEELLSLLDSVDARDSLTYLEGQDSNTKANELYRIVLSVTDDAERFRDVKALQEAAEQIKKLLNQDSNTKESEN